jgi:hypothetical protein
MCVSARRIRLTHCLGNAYLDAGLVVNHKRSAIQLVNTSGADSECLVSAQNSHLKFKVPQNAAIGHVLRSCVL